MSRQRDVTRVPEPIPLADRDNGKPPASSARDPGLGAIARDNVGVIIDEVFLGGRTSQDRLRAALGGVRVVWVGVRCDLEVAVARATRVSTPKARNGRGSSLCNSRVIDDFPELDEPLRTITMLRTPVP